MKRPIFSILLFLFFATGCASTSTQMINDKGQVANCGAWGFGIIGAPAALISTQNCIAKYQVAGFRESGSSQLGATGSPTAQVSASSVQAATTTPTTMSGKDDSFKITLPAGWIQAPPPSASQQLFARNLVIDAGLLVSSISTADVQDWQVYAESLRVKLVGNLTQSTSSETQKIKVNGLDALQSDTSGTLKNGVKIHYLGTIIKSDKKIVYLLALCFESKFSANRSELESLAFGLQL